MQNNLVHADEKIEDMQTHGLFLLQKKQGYAFNTDSVLLANFVRVKPKERYIDLCSGSGAVALLVHVKQSPQSTTAVECNADIANMCARSVEYNHLQNVQVVCADVRTWCTSVEKPWDVVSVNPPYFKVIQSKQTTTYTQSAKAEYTLCLNECVQSVAKCLKFGGRMYMVHRVERLAEVMFACKQVRLEPKVLRFIQPKPQAPYRIFLMEAVLGGKEGLRVEPPLLLLDEQGEETEEVKQMYDRKK